MALHNELGKEAENLAVKFFKEKGYEILFRNWRYSYYEIDMIATKDGFLHFIEVKSRETDKFGYPENNYTKKKFQHLVKAADEFMFRNPGYSLVQYDLLSVIIHKHKAPEYFLIEDISPPD